VGQAIELGRLRQHGFFEQLLQAEPAWLAFISRLHCRITPLLPSEDAGSQLRVQVENLSANVVLVSGCPLARGYRSIMTEGGSLAFVARRPGDTGGGLDVEFLRFTLRRRGGDDRFSPWPEMENTILRL